MREIKFRAFIFGGLDDGEKSFMEVVSLLEWENNSDRLIAHWTSHDEVSIVDKECYLMQYTGLKDKNGKEIYEGDIVERTVKPKYGKERIDKEIIEWYEGTDGEYEEYRSGFELGENPNKFEVIGNKFENPELIK